MPVALEYFGAAMKELCDKSLNSPLNAVTHPASEFAQQAAKGQQAAAAAAPPIQLQDLPTAQEWLQRWLNEEVVQQQSTPQEAEDQESGFKVFVAHPADNLRPIRSRLIAELKSRGMNIFGDIPPPYDERAHAGAASEALQQADLSIHLLSDLPGEPLDSDTPGKTFPMEQARLGQEHSRSQLILIPDEFKIEDITDPSYAEFMRTLRQQSRAAAHLEIVQTDRSQMLHEILAKHGSLKRGRHVSREEVRLRLLTYT